MNTYPFLVHSQESLSQQTAPNVDNQRLARQKRRRTSPDDQAILEAEYNCNPKPDKATRMEIVKKVALGEKEVQIWFQNRRQVTRRKSRPLLPHEILANLRTTSQSSQRVTSLSSSHDSSQQRPPSSQSSTVAPESQSSVTEAELLGNASQGAAGSREQQLSFQTDTFTASLNTEPLMVDADQKCDLGSRESCVIDGKTDVCGTKKDGGLLRSLSQAMSKKRKTESFGRRRNASFTIHDEESQRDQQNAEQCTPKVVEQAPHSEHVTQSSRTLRRTSSLVRISMSLEGKAQVTTRTGTTPSPPRPRPPLAPDLVRRPNSGLQRSFSAVEPMKTNTTTNSSTRRTTIGRSRDARTWEFYCDKDARDALTEQAEREESGSATAVIALIKSKSTNSAVTTHAFKRNARSHISEAAKRLKSTEGTKQKLKLSRSQSSLANMQTVNSTGYSSEETKVAELNQTSKSTVFEPSEGDSDKENWVPGTQQRSPPRRRPVVSPRLQRRILEESLRHTPSLGALVSQERNFSNKLSAWKSTSSSANSSMSEKENRRSEADDVFSPASGEISPRESDDLDCVQNLLSLSQAAWR